MSKIRILYSIILLIVNILTFSKNSFAQLHQLTGSIVDAQNGVPLAFVNISLNDGRFGGTSDIDGKFTVHSSDDIKTVTFSYVGYESQSINVFSDNKSLRIKLLPTIIQLNEVVILPGVNPAHRIIREAVKNRDKNNPRKLESFSYTAYDKLVMSVDSNRFVLRDSASIDTTKGQKIKDFLEKRDFFILETVTERSFRKPDRSHEKVIASRISGFNDPIFTFLLSQLQSTDFYDETIRIADKNYINPISQGSIPKYIFILEDQLITDHNDTLFSISYLPRPNTNFDGLKGVLTIHSGDWAITNVIAGPSRDEKGISVKIQQLYKKIDSVHWFPVQLNTDLMMNNAVVVSGNKQYPMVGTGKSYLQDIVLNDNTIPGRLNETAVEVMPNASNRTEEFWKPYRADSLSQRDVYTYQFMDSIGKEEKLDQLARTFETVLTGRIPLGFIDLDINRIIRLNAYEGFALGIGLRTNDRVSQKIKLGAFWSYGFGDRALKYGFDLSALLHVPSQASFRIAHAQDAMASGSMYFTGQSDFQWNEDNFRRFFVKQMEFGHINEIDFTFRALQHFKWEFSYIQQDLKSLYGYRFIADVNQINGISAYLFNEMRMGIRFAFREKFMQTNRNMLSLGTDYPQIFLTLIHGQASMEGLTQNYNKLEFCFDHTLRTKYYGNLRIKLEAGIVDAALPVPKLFYAPASYRNFSIFAPSSFATMRMNEFLSDREANLFLTHDFGKLLYRSKKFSPELALALNAAIGDLHQPEKHLGIGIQSMSKGFFEGGMLLNNLIRLPGMKLGAGCFYRLGAYSYPKISENFGYKFSMQLKL